MGRGCSLLLAVLLGLCSDQHVQSFLDLLQETSVGRNSDGQMLMGQTHDHSGDLGGKTVLLLSRDASLSHQLVEENLHVVKDKRTNEVLALVAVRVTVSFTRDERLEAHLVDLCHDLLFTLVPGSLRLGLITLFFSSRCGGLRRLSDFVSLLSRKLLSLGLVDRRQDSEKKLTLLSVEVLLERHQNFSGLLGMLSLEVATELLLIELLHHVSLALLLPLELRHGDLVNSAEEFLWHVESGFLSRLHVLVADEAKAQEPLVRLSIRSDSLCRQLQRLDVTKLGEVLAKLLCHLIHFVICRRWEALKVQIVAGELPDEANRVFPKLLLPLLLGETPGDQQI